MELPFILALLYSLQLLATFVALKASVKSELKYTKITIQSLNNKKITAETQPNQQSKWRHFCSLFTFLLKHFTLLGVLFSRKRGNSVVILFGYAVSNILMYFGLNWAFSASVGVFLSLLSILAKVKYWKSCEQWKKASWESIDISNRVMVFSKVVIGWYTSLTIVSLGILFLLLYRVLHLRQQKNYSELLIGYGLCLAADCFIYRPLSFVFMALFTSFSTFFLENVLRQNEYLKPKRIKEGVKGVINVSQQQLNDFLKQGEDELKEIKTIFGSSSCTAKRYPIESQFFKSKSINHISSNKEFFILAQNIKQSRRGQFKLKQKKTNKFFAINELGLDTQSQLDCQNYVRSLQESSCNPIIHLSQIAKGPNTCKSISQTNPTHPFHQDHLKFTRSSNQASDSEVPSKEKIEGQFYRSTKKTIFKETQLLKVEQLQTQMQEQQNQTEENQQLRQQNNNSLHRYPRIRKRRPTVAQSDLQQQNLIKIYLDDNKHDIKNFQPRRKQKQQFASDSLFRNRTGKHNQNRSKPIVHQSIENPRLFQLTDL